MIRIAIIIESTPDEDTPAMQRLGATGEQLRDIAGSPGQQIDQSHVEDLADAFDVVLSVCRRARASKGGDHA